MFEHTSTMCPKVGTKQYNCCNDVTGWPMILLQFSKNLLDNNSCN